MAAASAGPIINSRTRSPVRSFSLTPGFGDDRLGGPFPEDWRTLVLKPADRDEDRLADALGADIVLLRPRSEAVPARTRLPVSGNE
jgi:hypothetical protein